jgi:hypothetical protein
MTVGERGCAAAMDGAEGWPAAERRQWTDGHRSAAACRPSLLPPTATDAALCSHHPRTTTRCHPLRVFRLAATIPAPPSSRRRVSSRNSSGSRGSSSRSVPATCADGLAAGSVVVAAQPHGCRVLTDMLAVCDCAVCVAAAAGRLYQVRMRCLLLRPRQIRP